MKVNRQWYMRVVFCVLVGITVTMAKNYVGSSAELYTLDEVTYGRFDIRMRMVSASGMISSFFLWKKHSHEPDVFWHEIDIEVLGHNSKGFQSTIHEGIGDNLSHHAEFHDTPFDVSKDYHTYSIEWTPDYIAWFLDGEELRRVTGKVAKVFRDTPMQYRFNIWPSDNAGWVGIFDSTCLPVHQFINWIKYSSYTPNKKNSENDFTFEWEDTFSADTLHNRWAMGGWASPHGISVHSQENVTLKNGVVVLSCTPLKKTGYNKGLIPQDCQGGTTFDRKYRRGGGR